MLSQDDRHRLDALDAALRAQDRKFADGMRHGRPCPPREYRMLRLRRLLLLVVAIMALVGGLVAVALS
ncbi:MAG TPA: DUF3040 domain-containing protein [Micromonosporaceae bacterium]|jgi:hypothetical protein